MRTLIYVPIVHAAADLGSMAGELQRRFQEVFSQEQWQQRCSSVEAMWEGIRARLTTSPLPWSRVRLYQDGLPVCEHEQQIVADLACQGSLNHQLLLELVQRGAILMGTEDPTLMLAEYQRIQQLVQQGRFPVSPATMTQLHEQGEDLLRRRDAFIAQRLEATLQEEEVGILFIGLLHRVDEIVQGQFLVQHLIHSLPFGADVWWHMKESTHES